jgi:hypothetical protein
MPRTAVEVFAFRHRPLLPQAAHHFLVAHRSLALGLALGEVGAGRGEICGGLLDLRLEPARVEFRQDGSLFDEVALVDQQFVDRRRLPVRRPRRGARRAGCR